MHVLMLAKRLVPTDRFVPVSSTSWKVTKFDVSRRIACAICDKQFIARDAEAPEGQ